MAQGGAGEHRGGGRERANPFAPAPQQSASGQPGRVPPSDLEAERAVLSAILLDNDAIHSVYTEVKAEDFYHPAHQLLYGAMVALKDDNQPVDLTTLADYLNTRKLLDSVGGPVALAELSDYEATAANAVPYARIVRDKAVKRSLISVAAEIASMGYEQSDSADALLDAAESTIFALGEDRARTTAHSLEDELHDAMTYIDGLMENSGQLTGLATGFKGLDTATGGLQDGDLMILAARPSMGKTALALNIARNAALDHGKKVVVFSLEMTTRSLVLRMLSSDAEVDASVFRSGNIHLDAHRRFAQAAGRLAEANIWIDDSSAPTVLEIRAKSRRLHSQYGLDLVIVDYLQLARGDRRTDHREQEIAEISRGLKGLAKELKVPVLALSQLNRGPEMRENKRPILADLRESGAIEQDADIIGFIYREVVYNQDSHTPDLAELLIRKHRNGPTGTINLQFLARHSRFRDWTGDDAYAGAPAQAGFVSDDLPGDDFLGAGFVEPDSHE